MSEVERLFQQAVADGRAVSLEALWERLSTYFRDTLGKAEPLKDVPVSGQPGTSQVASTV